MSDWLIIFLPISLGLGAAIALIGFAIALRIREGVDAADNAAADLPFDQDEDGEPVAIAGGWTSYIGPPPNDCKLITLQPVEYAHLNRIANSATEYVKHRSEREVAVGAAWTVLNRDEPEKWYALKCAVTGEKEGHANG